MFSVLLKIVACAQDRSNTETPVMAQMSAIDLRFAQMVAKWKSHGATPRVVLGSASSSRRMIMDELASKHDFNYDVRTADIDEKAIRHDKPRDLVLALAKAKATAIQEKMKAAGEPMAGFLITCDQVCVVSSCPCMPRQVVE